MVTSWHRAYSALVSDKRELSFVFSCDHDAWLDGLVDLVCLTFIKDNLLCDNFDQVIGWWEAAVTLLYQPTKHIRNIVVHFVAVSQLFALLEDGVHSMMAPSEELTLAFLLSIHLVDAQMWVHLLHLRHILWRLTITCDYILEGLGPIHSTVAAHRRWLCLTVDDIFIADWPL